MDNGFKLKKGRSKEEVLDCEGGVRHWHRLPREALDVLSLGVFKARLDQVFASCSSGRCPCQLQGG